MNPSGLKLVDLLRRRRSLPLPEVVRLCADLPRLLDSRGAESDRPPKLLGDAWVAFAEGETQELDLQTLLKTPVTAWPKFSLKLGVDADADDDRTMASVALEPEGSTPALMLATLLFELLGGSQESGGQSRRYSPLPALNEDGNTILRQVLTRSVDSETCLTFWHRFLKACDVHLPRSRWRIPRWLLDVADTGDVLTLEPQGGGIPLVLIARPTFRIGRSRSYSDFPTRIFDSSGEVDEDATVQISRVQVFGEAAQTGLTLRDGDGKRQSANGSTWNGRLIAEDDPEPISAAGGELVLGGVYRLAVTPVSGPETELLPEIENLEDWSRAAVDPGDAHPTFYAVVFRPQQGQPLTRDAVWVGRGVGFRAARDGGLTWETAGLGQSPLHFLALYGCFWIANASAAENPPRINEASVGPGQIAPLATNQTLEFNGKRYVVTVD